MAILNLYHYLIYNLLHNLRFPLLIYVNHKGKVIENTLKMEFFKLKDCYVTPHVILSNEIE